MGRDVFYITTPIYYPNDVPHIGHAYDAVAADVIARHHRLRGEEVFHLTGTDEHGLKHAAGGGRKPAIDPQRWVDEMEPRWREVWERLDIAYDDYIRTTEPRHNAAVVKLLDEVHRNGRDDIYLDTYEGLYCVSCELYYAEGDLLEGGLCPIHERPVELVKEQNYFFRLSAYRDRLLEHYEQRSLRRGARGAEERGALADPRRAPGLLDQPHELRLGHPPALGSRSRHATSGSTPSPTTSPRPATAPTRSGSPGLWPANIHMIGKDILRQHAIYWPAMLMAAGIEPPKQVWAHGFLTVGGKKMSKTNATGIHPFELLDRFGVDSYRWYFLREVQFGQDGSFSLESMVDRHNAELANGIGNLASRVLAMLRSYFDGVVPEATVAGAESDLPQVIAEAVRRYDEEMLAVRPTAALARRLRRGRAGQSLHGRALPMDHGEGSREAGRARVDPLRLGRDVARADDPPLLRDAGRRQASVGAARHRANPRVAAARGCGSLGSDAAGYPDDQGREPLPEGRRGRLAGRSRPRRVRRMFHVNPLGCTRS